MKSEVIGLKTENKKEYPVLKQHKDGTIVLFVKNNTGTCLSNSGSIGNNNGVYRDTWNEVGFTKLPIGVKLVLEND